MWHPVFSIHRNQTNANGSKPVSLCHTVQSHKNFVFFSRDGEIVALKEDVNIIKNIISLVLYHLLSRYFPVVQTNLRKSIFDTFYMYLSQPSVVDHPINKLQLCP